VGLPRLHQSQLVVDHYYKASLEPATIFLRELEDRREEGGVTWPDDDSYEEEEEMCWRPSKCNHGCLCYRTEVMYMVSVISGLHTPNELEAVFELMVRI